MPVELTRVVGQATALPSTLGNIVPGGSGVPAVVLGGVSFDGFESPSRMPWGGEQRLVTHDLPGGARVVNAMGAVEKDIEFSGTLRGPDASSRARKVDALRKAGGLLTLTWADFSRRVVIKDFHADYTLRGQLVPYSVTLVVLPDAQPASEAPASSEATTALAQVSSLSSLTPALSGLSGIIDKAQSLIPGGIPALSQAQAALSGLSGVGSSITATLGAAEAKLDAFAQQGAGLFSSIVPQSGSAGSDAVRGLLQVSAASRVQALASSAGSLTAAATRGLQQFGGGV